MKILVTGATGTIGTSLVERLIGDGVEVRVLTRSPESVKLPGAVEKVSGDLLDVDALRMAVAGVDAMFLLSAVIAEELTATLTALNVAREAGLKGLVYLSVYKSAEFTDVPHETAKYAAERMIADRAMPATILRPTYFMQNDVRLKEAIIGLSTYPSPIGPKGVSVVDIRDIVDVAALELLRRGSADRPLPGTAFDLTGPDNLTGGDIAAIWSETLGKPIREAGDIDRTFQMIRAQAPAWMAYAIRQMFTRFPDDGAGATPDGLRHLQARLGRAPRSYRDFATETARLWSQP